MLCVYVYYCFVCLFLVSLFFPVCFLKRERKGKELDDWRGRKDLEGNKMWGVCSEYMKKNLMFIIAYTICTG